MAAQSQLVVRRGEALAAAARAQAALALAVKDSLGIGALPGATTASEQTAIAQAQTYEAWAEAALGVDPLLARAVLRLAQSFRVVARQAGEVRADARDALDSLADSD